MKIEQGYTLFDAPSLATRTSIRLGGAAIAEVRLKGPAGLEALPALTARLGGSVALFGEGTNIIAAEGDLPLVLVAQEPDFGLRIEEEREKSVIVRVEAGLRLPALLSRTATMGLSGLEGLAGIPGSVGGATAMNAGSYGVTFGELTRSLRIFTPGLGLVELPATDMVFAYRSCTLKERPEPFLVHEVCLELRKSSRQAVRESMRAVYMKKQATQPVTARSAGCVFKNPAPDAPAGRLLEEAGLKGLSVGGMRFSPLHANFLVNEGNGRHAEALELISLAQERVLDHSGHSLELEVRLWP